MCYSIRELWRLLTITSTIVGRLYSGRLSGDLSRALATGRRNKQALTVTLTGRGKNLNSGSLTSGLDSINEVGQLLVGVVHSFSVLRLHYRGSLEVTNFISSVSECYRGPPMCSSVLRLPYGS